VLDEVEKAGIGIKKEIKVGGLMFADDLTTNAKDLQTLITGSCFLI
jgi:hypothetical protein